MLLSLQAGCLCYFHYRQDACATFTTGRMPVLLSLQAGCLCYFHYRQDAYATLGWPDRHATL
jgi:hypothetical protein